MTEIIDFLKKYTDGKKNTEKVEISVIQLNRVIKALEQEPILDKIRAEITAISTSGLVDEHTMFVRSAEQVKQMALDVIDKYKAESEDSK